MTWGISDRRAAGDNGIAADFIRKPSAILPACGHDCSGSRTGRRWHRRAPDAAHRLARALAGAPARRPRAARGARRDAAAESSPARAGPAATPRDRRCSVSFAALFLFPAFELAGLHPTTGISPSAISAWSSGPGLRVLLIALLAYASVRIINLAVRRFEHEVAQGSTVDTIERAKRARTLGAALPERRDHGHRHRHPDGAAASSVSTSRRCSRAPGSRAWPWASARRRWSATSSAASS